MRMNPYITYQLFIELKNETTLMVGKLGEFYFPAGLYIYTGSAKKNFEARIQRHLSQDKKLRWHIDYLLNSPQAFVVSVERFVESECKINQLTDGQILIEKVGATDCHAACISHLKYIT